MASSVPIGSCAFAVEGRASAQMATLFSKQASSYALGRAIYPKSLFSYLASLTPAHSLAWDVGAGNGQAAVELADHYEKVIATDASEKQIQRAIQHPSVTYAVTDPHLTEEDVRRVVGADGSVDLVVCAQSLHWFDLDTFYGHVRRVLRNPGGVFAAWAYQYPSVTPAVDAVLRSFNDVISSEWAPQIQYIAEGYKTIPFPFKALAEEQYEISIRGAESPLAVFQGIVGSEPRSKLTTTGPFPFDCEREATLDEYLTHLRSWSAVQKAIDSGRDVWSEHQQKLFADAWGDSRHRTVKWTLHTLIGTL